MNQQQWNKMQNKPTSPKKHIVPAFYNWLSENDPKVFINVVLDITEVDITPYPPVNVLQKVKLVDQNGEEQEITMIRLNTDPQAVNQFAMTESGISFQCRLTGKVTNCFIPYDAVTDMYCPNSGLSQAFGVDPTLLNLPLKTAKVQEDQPVPPAAAFKKGHLSLVR